MSRIYWAMVAGTCVGTSLSGLAAALAGQVWWGAAIAGVLLVLALAMCSLVATSAARDLAAELSPSTYRQRTRGDGS